MENSTNFTVKPLDINSLHLPLSNVDKLNPKGFTFIYQLISKILGFNLRRVSLPEDLPGKKIIPNYALQEFHNIPNGYYSIYFSKGYSIGFENIMLGIMSKIRKEIAAELSDCKTVLDLGCGDGTSTKYLCDSGIENVWGLDPSPYLLMEAMQRNKTAQFVQGIAENTEFADENFDGISACWLFHEVPNEISDAILKECFRILKPGGKLIIMEPSKLQLRKSKWQILKQFGLKGLYYRILAKLAHEPYLLSWQNKEIRSGMADTLFQLIEYRESIPEEKIVLQKPIQ